MILDELENAGQNIRRAYQRRLPSDQTKDYYFMQRNTGNTESITIEYGFLDSKGDDVNQLKSNWQKYAEAVVRAIAKYKNFEYREPNSDLQVIYKVLPGDSLWSISKKFNINVDELKNYNNLKSNLLNIGQILNIPQEKSVDEYIVKKGDTLYNIAKKFKTTVKEIMEINNLTTNLLNIGQKLFIPKGNQQSYIVKKGDTLYSIANQFSTTVNNLLELNNLKTNILSIGQILKVI